MKNVSDFKELFVRIVMNFKKSINAVLKKIKRRPASLLVIGKVSIETQGCGYGDYEGHPVNRTWFRSRS